MITTVLTFPFAKAKYKKWGKKQIATLNCAFDESHNVLFHRIYTILILFTFFKKWLLQCDLFLIESVYLLKTLLICSKGIAMFQNKKEFVHKQIYHNLIDCSFRYLFNIQ